MSKFLDVQLRNLVFSIEKSRSAVFERQGLEISVSIPDGPNITSVASPLVGFSQENISEVHEAASQMSQEIFFSAAQSSHWENALEFFHHQHPDLEARLPSLSFACECLILQLHAYLREENLPQVFQLSESATLPSVPLFEWERREYLFDISLQNDQVVKLKFPSTPPTASSLLELFSTSSSKLHFRLDANQAFSMNDTKKILSALESHAHRIDFFEEPLHEGDLSKLQELQSEFPNIPLAADESLRDAISLCSQYATPLICIFKPSLGPGLLKSAEILRNRSSLGLRSILSTAGEAVENFRCLLAFSASCMPDQERVGFGIYPKEISPNFEELTLLFQLSTSET